MRCWKARGTPVTIDKALYHLKEYETTTGVVLSAESVAQLRKTFGAVLTLRPGPRETWDVTASSYVGHIELSDAIFHIRPKLAVETLWDWLTWAYDISSLRFQPPVTSVGELTGNSEWLVLFFIKECFAIWRKGLRAEYEQQEQGIGEVRGQLRVAPTLQKWMKQEYRFVCAYDEPTRQGKENKLLYTGIRHMVRRRYRNEEIGRELEKLLRLFESAEKGQMERATLPVSASEQVAELARVRITRLNRQYARALSWLTLYWKMTELSTHEGNVFCDSFILDMNELFERYIARRLAEGLRMYGIEMQIQPRYWLAEANRLRIIPDLILKNRSGREIVLDAKYKARAEKSGNSDVYQMLAYMTARSTSSGILLYAAGLDRVDKIRNTDKKIYQWSLGIDEWTDRKSQDERFERIVQHIVSMLEEK